MYKEKTEELAKKARKLDPYFGLVSSKKLIGELKDELDEVFEALKENNCIEIEKELGDVFWVYQLLLQKINEEKKINISNIYEKIYKKMSSRKSFLEKGIKVTEEEAKEIWNKAKLAEGYSKDRLWNDSRINCK